ncbi:hypothetical protein HC081234_04050 [Helicobacter cinaedi]|nr:hypothetical protein HC081234_04050 [Helicobacter cinaedi]
MQIAQRRIFRSKSMKIILFLCLFVNLYAEVVSLVVMKLMS